MKKLVFTLWLVLGSHAPLFAQTSSRGKEDTQQLVDSI